MSKPAHLVVDFIKVSVSSNETLSIEFLSDQAAIAVASLSPFEAQHVLDCLTAQLALLSDLAPVAPAARPSVQYVHTAPALIQ